MSLSVMLIVLMAAVLHAGWNALIKSGSDKLTDTILLSIGAGVVSAAILPFLPFPAEASWGLLGASTVMQAVYYCLLAAVYKTGDFSFAYPLMRGSAPLFTALVSTFILKESLGTGGWLAIVLVCSGILCLFVDNVRKKNLQKSVLFFGLLNAGVIATYTILDGLGVRLSGHTLSYILWVFFLNGIVMAVIGLLFKQEKLRTLPLRTWLKGFLSGSFSLTSYGLALWAMTQAPIALVAGLRETSILFGIAIASIIMKESFSKGRWLAVALIMSGTIVMKTL